MKAMILAAGLGTRLQPLTGRLPKPLLPLMLVPLLAHLLAQLRRQGVREVVVNGHHLADRLAAWLGDGRRWGLRVTFTHEADILGTAGALKNARAHLQGAPFLVINADVLADFDLQALWSWHRGRGALVTMVVRPGLIGPVTVDEYDRVRQINGRPKRTGAGPECQGVDFTGIQIVEPQVLDAIPAGRFVSTTADTYPLLLQQGQPIFAYRHLGFWLDVGVPERYLRAHWDLLDGVLGAFWEEQLPAGSRILRGTARQRIDGATLHPPVVMGVDATLGHGARVGPYAVLGAGCRLGPNAAVSESVLGDGTAVGGGAVLRHCILAPGARVPDGQSLQEELLA
ncbi:MAG: NDP-sugar synthase [Candidatus Tectomicrobia bacterium]|nr:NDP-sugar synthase [Candidatus Tectomicrobia bacterium]